MKTSWDGDCQSFLNAYRSSKDDTYVSSMSHRIEVSIPVGMSDRLSSQIERQDKASLFSSDLHLKALTSSAQYLKERSLHIQIYENPLDLGIGLDPPVPVLQQCVNCLPPRFAEDWDDAVICIAKGLNLVSLDAQATFIKQHKVPAGLLNTLAQRRLRIPTDTNKQLLNDWSQGCRALVPLGLNVHVFVLRVLRESYHLQSQRLLDYADKVRFYNRIKQEIRTELQQARSKLSTAVGEDETSLLNDPFMPARFNMQYTGAGSICIIAPSRPLSKLANAYVATQKEKQLIQQMAKSPLLRLTTEAATPEGIEQTHISPLWPFSAKLENKKNCDFEITSMISDILANIDSDYANVSGQDVDNPPIMTKAELESYLKQLEEQLNSIGDDAQLANVDLQNALHKQQQTIQMLTNIGKVLHDSHMAIGRKI